MSVKKLITFATAGIASVGVTSAAVAGGPDYISAPSYAGAYVEDNVGYVYRPWRSDVTTVPGTPKNFGVLSSSSNGNGGFTFGGDLGYQFNQYFSVEGGWFYLPKAKFTIDPTTFRINAGVAYAALKAMASVYENAYVFGKLGVAYTYNQSNVAFLSSDLTKVVRSSNYWNPLFAAGVQYYFTPNWSMNAQYTFVPGYRSASSSCFVAPVVHLFTVGIGYKLLM